MCDEQSATTKKKINAKVKSQMAACGGSSKMSVSAHANELSHAHTPAVRSHIKEAAVFTSIFLLTCTDVLD